MRYTVLDKTEYLIRRARADLMAEKCLYCKEIMGYGGFVLCPKCSQRLKDTSSATRHVEGCLLLVSTEYTEEIRPLIHSFKYRGNREVGMFLADRIWETCKARDETDFDLVLGVPRYRQRGSRKFCQAEYLAERVAMRLESDFSAITLYKARNIISQTYCKTPSERQANVSGAYKVRESADVKGKRILLVDDVTTTGATLGECAKALLAAGAERVVCVTATKPVNPEKRPSPISLGKGYYDWAAKNG